MQRVQQALQDNPQMLAGAIAQLAQENPQILQAIQQNPQALGQMLQDPNAIQQLMMLMQGGGGGLANVLDVDANADYDDGDNNGGGGYDDGGDEFVNEDYGMMQQNAPQGPQPTAQEKEAIDRLVAMGFTKQQATEAYFLCDKNEDLAANYLFDNH